MNERQRQTYLQAMGVDQYFPRVVLPGALPSSLCEVPALPVEAETIAQVGAITQAEVQTSKPQPAPNLQQIKASMQIVGGNVGNVAAAQPVNKPVRSEPVEAASDIPHFALTIAKTESGILILDEGLSAEQDYTEYLRLLQNMLLAVGAGQQAIQLDPFVWPMVQNGQIDQSEMAAKQTLSAYLSKLIDDLSVRYLLVMGNTAEQYLAPVESVLLIKTVSALQMLATPTLKRQAWDDLQVLKKALQT